MGRNMGVEENLIFPIYLFFASIANVAFLYVTIRDAFKGSLDQTSATILLALSIAELIWVVPCWLQCLANLAVDAGNYWFVASNYKNDKTGCDITGFYSIFASVSGQLLVTLIAYVSYNLMVAKREVTQTVVSVGVTASYLIAFLLCLLPLCGVGSFKFSGEGFCYIDWTNTAQVVTMELVTWPCMAATLFFYGSCALAPPAAPINEDDSCVRGPPSPDPRYWWLLALAYASAWVLWIPAGFIGTLSDKEYPDMFPAGYMIAGGTLGHLQAMLNPVLYGIFWRQWFQNDQAMTLTGKDYGSGSGSDTPPEKGTPTSMQPPIPGHIEKRCCPTSPV